MEKKDLKLVSNSTRAEQVLLYLLVYLNYQFLGTHSVSEREREKKNKYLNSLLPGPDKLASNSIESVSNLMHIIALILSSILSEIRDLAAILVGIAKQFHGQPKIC